MNLNIRKATKNDLCFIQKYENLYFNKTSKRGISNEIFNNPLINCFVLENKSTNIGYAIIWLDEDKSQIHSLVIKPSERHKGYAKTLLDYLFKYYNIKKIKEISLEVRITNKKAIDLYKGLGFKEVSIRKNYYNDNEDALLLYRKL